MLRRRTYLVPMLLAAAAFARPGLAHAQTPYKLVWSDEFSGAAGSRPDPANWQIVAGPGAKVGGNAEAETYCDYLSAETPCNAQQPNVYLDGRGHLVIVAIKTDKTVPVAKGTAPVYTSARLHSTRDFRYGRIEASLRVPTGQGVWPAFWAMGRPSATVHWPATGEIDIMESWNPQPGTATVDPFVNHSSVHGPVAPGSAEGYTDIITDFRFPRPMQETFHQFAAEWSPGQVDYFCDGLWYGQQSVASLSARQVWELDNAPIFLLLNLAMGGDFFGYPNDTTPKNPTLIADYIRVYARAEGDLPANWGNADIGGPAQAGHAESHSGVWTVAGSGVGIAGRVDQFHFAYHSLAGDGEVSAHVLDQTAKNPQAKAGIMLRDGRGSGAIYALLFVSPDGTLHFRARGNPSDVPGESPITGIKPGTAWLKLTRAADLITALVSADGKSWQKVGQAALKMPRDILAGLVSTARDNAAPNLARFDYVFVTPTDAAWDGRATRLPGTLQAESFNTGGAGYSYTGTLKPTGSNPFRHDDGPAIRQISTQPEPATVPGGFYVTGLHQDDYLNYSVFVEKEGDFVFHARVASAGPGGSFRINLDQKPITRPLSIPDTGSAESWRLVSTETVHLAAGQHTLAVVISGTGAHGTAGNLDFLTATAP